ncbi:hypothetical protein Tco_1149491 [Tanacetum coccineum]
MLILFPSLAYLVSQSALISSVIDFNQQGITAIVSKLDSLGQDINKLKENVHAIQVGCQTCGGAHLDKECPLNEEVKILEEVKYGEYGRPFPNYSQNNERFNRRVAGYGSHDRPSSEEIEYFSANSGFSDNEKQETDESGMEEALASLEITPKIKQVPQEEKQSVSYHVDSYEPPIPFPRRLKHHAEEELVHETMESLNKIKINCPLLKEIRQTNNYAKHIKGLLANKPRTKEDEEIRMNPRCSALL